MDEPIILSSIEVSIDEKNDMNEQDFLGTQARILITEWQAHSKISGGTQSSIQR